MSHDDVDQMILDEVAADARLAIQEFDDARAWLREARQRPMEPLGVEVWVTDPTFEHVLLVRHPWRGWVPPGGKVEQGEGPRAAAVRECLEETGLQPELLPEPAAVMVRSYQADRSPTLSLSYAAIAARDLPLSGEPGQPPAWFSLDADWDSVFPDDRERIRSHAQRLGQRPG
ncbi:NUDIX hydrolase [Herbidospora mongoliensis]|uniref:NUDIX hydrolase n=1 Tax=Herbidospora mongoliensis TaxID=688067 RepID=UPI0009FCD409|nr:NUDIX hydrolase [Herbidospora mongoliensis]